MVPCRHDCMGGPGHHVPCPYNGSKSNISKHERKAHHHCLCHQNCSIRQLPTSKRGGRRLTLPPLQSSSSLPQLSEVNPYSTSNSIPLPVIPPPLFINAQQSQILQAKVIIPSSSPSQSTEVNPGSQPTNISNTSPPQVLPSPIVINAQQWAFLQSIAAQRPIPPFPSLYQQPIQPKRSRSSVCFEK